MPTVKIGDVCKTNALSYSAKDNWNYVNYLDTGNITEDEISEIQRIELNREKLPSRAKRKVKYNSIIYSTVRPIQRHYGIVKSQPENFLVSTGFTVIDLDERVADADYIYYFLTQNSTVTRLQEIAEQTTSSYPSIKASDIEQLTIELPDLAIQKRIASILLSFDLKRKQNEQINKNLEHQAAAIYKAWFVDFTPYGGILPSSWRYAQLSDVADVTSGKRPPIKGDVMTSNAPYPLVGAAAVMGYTSSKLYEDNQRILVTGRVGTHGIIQRFRTACWPSDNTLVITSNYYEFVCQVLSGIDYKSMNRGSSQPLISQNDLKKANIVLPDSETMARFESIVGTLMDKWEENRCQNEKLAMIRDSLLPKLMSGELDVSNIGL